MWASKPAGYDGLRRLCTASVARLPFRSPPWALGGDEQSGRLRHLSVGVHCSDRVQLGDGVGRQSQGRTGDVLAQGHARAAVPPERALEDSDLLGYAAQLGLDVAAFDRDRASTAVAERIRRDVDSGLASGQVSARRPCSSTASSTPAVTTRPPCWPCWPHEPPARSAPAEGDQKPRRSLTMIAVTRPGVITLLMMTTLFTPLGTP
jgi:hypothetical protein